MIQPLLATLPLALGVALTPVALVTLILLRGGRRGRGAGGGFLFGWVLGVVVVLAVVAFFATVLPAADQDAAASARGILTLVAGILLLLLAVRAWLVRPKDGEEPEPPVWMRGADQGTFGLGFALGFFLSALRPRNLLLLIAAGLVVGADPERPIAALLTLVGAVALVASLAVIALPVVAALSGRPSSDAGRPERLDGLRRWLVLHGAVVDAVVCLALGVLLIVTGAAQL